MEAKEVSTEDCVNGKSDSYIVLVEEFKNENPYTEEQREALRQKALSDGRIVDCLIVNQQKQLVWGYEEYAIAKKHHLPFETKELEFESKPDCLAWIAEKRLAIPCLNMFKKIELGYHWYQYWLSKDEAKNGEKSLLKKAAEEKYGRADKLAIIGIKVGTSHNTVFKARNILDSENKDLIGECHAGEISISRYMRVYRDRESIKSNTMLDLPPGEQPLLTEIYDSVSDGQSRGGVYNVNRNDYFNNSKNSTIYTPKKLSEFIYSLLKHLKPKTIVDPSIGKGSLVKPWKQPVIIGIDIDKSGSKYCDAFIHGRFEDIDEWKFENMPDLVLCNPPFNNAPHRELYPEVFLRKIFDLFGENTPTVLFVPMGFRLNIRNSSQRWKWLSSMDNISSIISLPIDCFGIKYHTEILLFNITGVKPHYFC